MSEASPRSPADRGSAAQTPSAPDSTDRSTDRSAAAQTPTAQSQAAPGPSTAHGHGPSGASAAATGPELSVVVPVYRNEGTLVELLDRLDATLADVRREYLFVIDGSPDGSHALLVAEQARRPWLVVVDLARNCGQHAALAAGFELARGRAVAVLDADLQQDPEELPAFLEAWRAGHDFVSGWRTSRADPLDRKLGSVALNWLVRRITGVDLHDWGCPLAVIDAAVIERVAGGGEQRRFLKPLVAKLSRRPTEIKIAGRPRVEGKSSYSSLALLGVTLDFAVSFANRPFLKLIGLGAVGTAAGGLAGALYLTLRVLGLVRESPPVVALVALALLLGAQVLILGAMGEFTHRIYRLVQGQPLFEVRAVRRVQGAPAAAEGPDRDEDDGAAGEAGAVR